MWWQWVIFSVVFLGVPVGLNQLKHTTTKGKTDTKEQEKQSNNVFAKLCFFYWLCDLFYMAHIINNLICKFVFGLFVMVTIFTNLVYAFISGIKRSKFANGLLLQDFLVGVALTVYLIYIIPGKTMEINGVVVIDNSLREIITTIVSAVYGGLLTLVGVAWTIRKGDDDRRRDITRIEEEKREDERKRYLPFLNLYTDVPKTVDHTISFYHLNFGNSTNVVTFHMVDFIIKNTNFNAFCLRGMVFNDHEANCNPLSFIEKNWSVKFSFLEELVLDNDIQNIYLLFEDVLGNHYSVQLDFVKEKKETGAYQIKIKGCYRPVLMKG